MLANIDRLRAADMLEQAQRGDISLTAEGWFDLTLLATGSRERAEEAMIAYISREQKAGRTPQ